MKKQPTVDPVQVFCSNFPSYLDLSGPTLRWIPEVNWSDELKNSICLRISRYSLEVLQLVLDESAKHEHLARAVLEFYAPSPIERFCDCNKIASALRQMNLSELEYDELVNQLTDRVHTWLELATKRAQQLLPDVEIGQTGWVRMEARVVWGVITPGSPMVLKQEEPSRKPSYWSL